MATRLPTIEPLEESEDPHRWLQRFEICATLNDWKDDKKRNAFLALLGKRIFNLLADAVLPDKLDTKDFDTLSKLLTKEVKGEKSVIASRYEFHKAKQENNEDIATYSRRLKQLSEACKFTDSADRLRDQFIFGLQSKEILRKLLSEKIEDLTWDKVTAVAAACEAVQRGEKDMTGLNVLQMRQTSGRPQKGSEAGRKRSQKPTSEDKNAKQVTCYCCGKPGHLKSECRFKSLKCDSCGKLGHLRSVCRASKTKAERHRESSRVRLVLQSPSMEKCEEDQCDKIFSMTTSKQRILRTVSINGTSVEMVFDTGADASLVSKHSFEQLSQRTDVMPADRTFKDYQGCAVPLFGKSIVTVQFNGITTQLPIFIVDRPGAPNIYGLEWMHALEPHLNIYQVTHFEAHLVLKDEARPVFLKPRPIPYGIRESVKQELDRLESEGILKKIDQSEWATPIVVVRKQSGKIRICGDYKVTVNKSLCDMVSTTPCIEDVLSQLGGAKIFSVLDLTNAYLQLPVDDASGSILTLSTPFGLYQPKALAYGVKQAPAIFQGYMDKLLASEKNVVSYQDDILIYGKTEQEHDNQINVVTRILQENNVVVNYQKSALKRSRVKFLGLDIGSEGICPAEDKMEAIRSLADPRSVKELRSFLGLAEFYSRFIKNLSTIKEPLAKLVRQDEEWRWGPMEQSAFQLIKTSICESKVIKPFDPSDSITRLTTDASPYGLGAVLEQSKGPVMFVSKTLSKPERNYAQIEREALGIIWAVKRLHKYLYARKFVLVTDHHPLKYIFDPAKSLNSLASARIQRWAISLASYDYTVECRRSEEIPVADALSRLTSTSADNEQFDVSTVQDTVLNMPVDKKEIRRQSLRDPTMRKLFAQVKHGWTVRGKNQLPEFSRLQSEFSIEDGILYRGIRTIIPTVLRDQVLRTLHDGHLGAEKMKSIARQCVWWPSVDADIQQRAKACKDCQQQKDHAKSEWIPWPQETEKWSRVHIDYAGPFNNGKYCLIIIDAYSKWAEVHLMSSTTTEETILRLRRTFAQEGVPLTLVSDNGPQFTSKHMENWLQSIGCKHILTPPYHPRSNGQAERFVRDLKSHLRAAQQESCMQANIDRFLLQYRNAKHAATGKSPAEMMRGHLLRGPITQLSKQPVWVKVYNDHQRKWAPGVVINSEGKAIVNVEGEDGNISRRHLEQIKPRVTDAKEAEEDTSHSDSKDQARPEDANKLYPTRNRRPPDRLQYKKLGTPNKQSLT
ncbi:hypothetical protein BOX15_Mlig025062g1 [Macrostomum lignano]|uniref:RNA-directed DNA polymerase n=1 Tax=Macrostomum lignano TaxID=282301 RepID=A0A267EF28_9PLAT|nr:hypothetical protein BOX15_Mlig025062g1 [Macrostomum lignano]